MKQFLVVQHTYSEFLGAIEKQLEDRDIGFLYFRPFTGQNLPANALQYDALWLLGGACPVTDRERCPWVDDELRLIRAFRRAGRPIVGFGFGGELVAHALGGTAHAEPEQRAYWTTARSTEAGRDDPVARAVDGRKVLVMTNGHVELPPQVRPIVVDERGDWIAVREGDAYGLLFRPELKPGTVEDMIMEEGRPLPDDIGGILEEARARWQQTQLTTGQVVAALVAALDLMRERRKPPVFALRAVRDEG
ncbi:MAG: GMP synthase [Betaproteobacteria bacterium]|nr:GMP synthase [Betaproteobacteria bacterium]